MKKYEQPAIELIKFSIMDVLTTSETDSGFNTDVVVGDPNKTSEEVFNDFGL